MLTTAAMDGSGYLRARTLNLAGTGVIMTDQVGNEEDLRRYFEYAASHLDTIDEGVVVMTFGEYLVERQVIDRFQLFRALQLQDRLPGIRLGECAAALGYASIQQIEQTFASFTQLPALTVD